MVALIVIGCILAALAVVVAWGVWENHALQCHEVTVESEALPAAFDGFTVVHVSDLHNARFGRAQEKLLDRIAAANPDMIAVTGDLIDKRRPGMRNALCFAEGAVRLAPVFYAAGNHEAKSREFESLQVSLERLGVTVLSDRVVRVTRGNEQIAVAGILDARFRTRDKTAYADVAAKILAQILPHDGAYTVLLSHRPELFSVYRAAGADLALCGHAHGGQFRIPFLGGLIAPDQGLFPKYSQGRYREDGADMVVSRGLGNSSVPIRLNNRPEIVKVILRRK